MGRVVVTRGGFGGNSHYPMTGKQLKESCNTKVYNKVNRDRKAIAAARQEGKDPVKAFMDTAGVSNCSRIVREVKGEDKGRILSQ